MRCIEQWTLVSATTESPLNPQISRSFPFFPNPYREKSWHRSFETAIPRKSCLLGGANIVGRTTTLDCLCRQYCWHWAPLYLLGSKLLCYWESSFEANPWAETLCGPSLSPLWWKHALWNPPWEEEHIRNPDQESAHRFCLCFSRSNTAMYH